MLADKTTLIFVYNADSGLFSAATDFVKKIVAPDSYQCQLCRLTYGAISMKNPWKDYLETIANKKRFLHRDEFIDEFPEYSATALPVIFVSDNSQLTVLVSAEEINGAKDLVSLKRLLQAKLEGMV